MIITPEKCFTILILSLLTSLNSCTSKQEQAILLAENHSSELQSAGDGTCLDVRTGRIWQTGKSRKITSLQEAETYVKNLRLAGHSDWRIPTRQDLFSLHDILFQQKNGDCPLKQTGNYWTIQEDEGVAPGHWETDYICGPVYKFIRSYDNTGYVRAVRQ